MANGARRWDGPAPAEADQEEAGDDAGGMPQDQKMLGLVLYRNALVVTNSCLSALIQIVRTIPSGQ